MSDIKYEESLKMESLEVIKPIISECIVKAGLIGRRPSDEAQSNTSAVPVLSSQSSQTPLVSCDICQNICRRAVSLPCCQSQACRACAVKGITTYKSCWGCQKSAVTSDLKIELGLREAVKVISSGRLLEARVSEELDFRRKARDALDMKREHFRFGPSSSNGVGASKHSVIDISDTAKANPDQSEEDDIQDHRWKPLKETRTDRERVLLAKKMFSNAVESDPNRNLSFHGFRSRQGLSKRTHIKTRLKESSFEINSGNIEPLPGFKKLKKNNDEPKFMTDAESNFKREKIKVQDIPEVMKDVFLKQLQDRYGAKYTDEDYKELKRFVQHYVKGFKETSDFFSFYNLGDTEKQVSRERLEEMVDMEKLLGKFSKYYGDIEKILCKECWVEHRF